MFRYFCQNFVNTRAPDRELEAEYSIRMFPPYASFTVYDHRARVTRTLTNTQYNFQSRETEAQTTPNQAWQMNSGMHCRGVFRMIEPAVIPPGATDRITWNVEASWAPAFMNARADLPPNFLLFSLRPRRGGQWIETNNPPAPFNWAVPQVPRNVPQPNPPITEEVNHVEEEEEGGAEETVEEEERRVEEERRDEEEEVVVVDDESQAGEEEEQFADGSSDRPGEYYRRGESEGESEGVRHDDEEGRGEEEVVVVEEITEEQIFGTPWGARNIPFTVFGRDGVVANPEDFILVESDESPVINHGSPSELRPLGC